MKVLVWIGLKSCLVSILGLFMLTSVMYPAYAKWVQSHRDLPIKLNQWCNVVVSLLLQPSKSTFCIDIIHTPFIYSILQVLKKIIPLYFFIPTSLLLEMGVQTPSALPKDERVSVAGGTYSICHQRRGSWGGNRSANSDFNKSVLTCKERYAVVQHMQCFHSTSSFTILFCARS